jgi:hypothetical protein
MSYHPGPVPSQGVDPALRSWLSEEMRRIAVAIAQVSIPVTDVEPAKPFKTMQAWALGVNWNPGAGEGLYVYNGATWDKVN